MGAPYFPHPQPGSVASRSANKKRKAEVAKKLAAKKSKAGSGRAPSSRMVLPPPKVGQAKKLGILKIAQPKAKPGPRGRSEIELALSKLVGVSKKFHILDVAASSHARTTGATTTRTVRVPAFDNLGDDSSSDVCEARSPRKMMEKLVSPPPLVSGEFLCFSFTIFATGPDNFFCRSYSACALTRFAAGEPRQRPGVHPSSHKFCFASTFLHYHACSDRLLILQALAMSEKHSENRNAESA
jgi:hypothetical protein